MDALGFKTSCDEKEKGGDTLEKQWHEALIPSSQTLLLLC